MGCGHSLTCGALHHFAISSFLFLIIVTSSSCTQFRFNAQAGRPIMLPIGYAKIGSKPPSCDRRCNSCSHCEAIQVPTNPQHKGGDKNYNDSPESTKIAYSRGGGDDYSNYKPMSWKCKCGDLIFNP